jgi:heme/copper-type cytochrome/quinol oxidase subunit 3
MKDRTILGMVLFIASESVFFLLLVLAYVNFHKTTGATAAAMLDPIKTGIFSIALISSSVTLYFAELAHKKDSDWFKIWLFVTIALGVVFLTGQGLEYAHLIGQKMTISRDLFGSTFFTLTGFHGLHVFIGLILLGILLGLALWGRKQEPSKSGIVAISLYWHFVDAVWLVVFSVIYLWRYV